MEEEQSNIALINKQKEIDVFFETQGYKRYQYILFAILFFILFSDSLQILLMTLILKTIKQEWNLSETERSCLMSSIFMGMVIGSFFVSKYLDLYGRKMFVIYGGVVLLFFSILSSQANSFFSLLLSRIIIGIGIGVQMPAGINLASESIPIYNRSIFLSSVWLAFPIGEIYCCIVAWIIMPNFETGKWRTLIIYCCFPIVLCLFIGKYIFESARFLYTHGKYEEGKEVLKNIETINNSDKRFTEDQFRIIEKESEENIMNKYKPDIKELFKPRFIGITLKTWVLWCASDVGLYLTIYMIPQVLARIDDSPSKGTNTHNHNSFYIDMLITSIIALPKAFIAGVLAEYLGRIKSMLILLSFACFFSIILLLTDSYFSTIAGLLKLVSGGVIMNIKVYSTECYPTKLRGIGSSVGHSVGRLLIVIIPFICQFFEFIFSSDKAPFLFVFMISALGIYCAATLPFETMGRELDKPEKEDFIELSEMLKTVHPENFKK